MADAPYALVSLIDNDQRLYRMRQHADKQLALKKARGVYDRERARSAYTGLVELLARDAEKALADYEERQPHPWHVAWSKAERTATEKELVARFENAWANPKSAEHTELLKALPKKFQGGAFAEQLSDDDVKARRKGAFTLAQLEALPAISEGHTSDLKWDTGRTRVWLSRMSKEDGMPYDNQVIVETRQHATGKAPLWKTTLKYQAKGRPLSALLLPKLEAEAAYVKALKKYHGKQVSIGRSEHPGQALLQSTQLTRNQLLALVSAGRGEVGALRRGMAAGKAKAARHESGGNPRTTRYRGVEIEATSGGWYVAFIPDLGYLKSDTLAGARELVRNALAKPGAAKHESGNNPRTKKHPLDAAAVQRIERAAARKHIPSSVKPITKALYATMRATRKRWPQGASAADVQRIERAAARKHIPSSVKPITKALYATMRATRKRWPQGASAADVGLKARVDALVGRSKK